MIIGLTGAAGAGKDTAKDILLENLPGLTLGSSFAWSLKAAFDVMFPSIAGIYNDREQKDKPREELGGHSPRFVLQTLGTEWGRETVSSDIWVHSLESRIRSEEFDHLVISDVRFDNEAKWIHENDGIILWIIRQGESFPQPDNPKHKSEKGLSKHYINAGIYNPGDSIEAFGKILMDFINDAVILD